MLRAEDSSSKRSESFRIEGEQAEKLAREASILDYRREKIQRYVDENGEEILETYADRSIAIIYDHEDGEVRPAAIYNPDEVERSQVYSALEEEFGETVLETVEILEEENKEVVEIW